MRLKEEISIYKVNLFYLILAIVFLFASAITQMGGLYFSILVTHILIIAFASFMFIKKRGFSLKKAFRLNRLGMKNTILIFFISILSYPIVVFFQAIFVTILQIFTELLPNELPIEIANMPFITSIFFIAIIPGVCEEIMFRGTMLRGYEKLGVKKSIIITAVLFGMFHFNISNFIGPTILGIIFGIMVYKTNSIFSSMLAHTLNNTIAIVLSNILLKNIDIIEGMPTQDPNVDNVATIISFIIIGVVIIGLINLVKSLLNRLTPSNLKDIDDIEDEDVLDEPITTTSTTSISSYFPLIVVAVMFFVFNIIFIFI